MINNYKCSICNYETHIHCNYEKHLLTKKHKQNEVNISRTNKYESRNSKYENSTEKYDSYKLKCHICDKLISKSNKAKHIKICDKKYKLEQKEKEIEIDKMKLQREKLELEEMNKKLQQEKDDLQHKLNNIALNIWNNKTKSEPTVNIQNINVLTINYIRKKFNHALNFNDLMAPKLTYNEKKSIELSPINGCYELIRSRCVDDLELEKMPIHCVDISRDKYALRKMDEWIIVIGGDQIISEVDKHVSSIFKEYDLNKKEDIEKQIKIMEQMLTQRHKIIDYLRDDIILKNNAKRLIK